MDATFPIVALRRLTDDGSISLRGDAVRDPEHEARLVERARHDREAFAALYREHYAAIGAYLFRRSGDVHATEDLLSEVFLAALRGLPRYRTRGVPFRNWLYRIATREVNRWALRERKRPERLASPSEIMDTRKSADSDDRAWVQRCLLAIAPRYQAALTLHYVEGLSVDEVARTLGCRPGTVKSRLARGRAALDRVMRTRR
ncbi:MAG: RNA polymerase sigma factor [Planctomycetes bacterium]|nr:RNA polymerase sigma factor [Planctomycetota bacterium]MBI3846365.1 RNA polymerase sigma factor [Planctomycetota bacterium]